MNSREFFPDGQETLQIGNQTVRKGTVGAFIQNALALQNPELDAKSREAILADVVHSIADMRATRIFEVFEIRNPELRKLVEQQLEKLPSQ